MSDLPALYNNITDTEVTNALNKVADVYKSHSVSTLVPILPLLLNLEGYPFTLKDHFPMEPLYRCDNIPPRFILKCGRQVSKCVPGNSIVITDNGPRRIKDLRIGDTVISWNSDQSKFIKSKITKTYKNGSKPCKRLTLSNGLIVETTKEHKLFSKNTKTPVMDLSEQDSLTICSNYRIFGNINLTYDEYFEWAKKLYHNETTDLWNLDFISTIGVLKSLLHFSYKNNEPLESTVKLKFLTEDSLIQSYSLFFKSGFTPTDIDYDQKSFTLCGKSFEIYKDIIKYFNSHENSWKEELSKQSCLNSFSIEKIEDTEDQEVYDIEVETTHNYILNGVLSSNSTSLAAQGIIRSAALPFLKTLFVSPLFEQVRRFSNNVVRPFIDNSPVKNYLIGEGFRKKDQSVFQRTLANQSNMYFTFAYLDAERVRGIAADILCLDEVQDLDLDFMPILQATLSASKKFGFTQMSGTPKTTDNTIHYYWEKSSQAEWVTKCDNCGEYNIAGIEFGLDDMVTPEGFCCKKCKAPLQPRNGFWYHMYKDRVNSFPGFHVPQPILPMHYENKKKWADIIEAKMEWPTYRYQNEILGESCDVGSRLLTRNKLQEISVLDWTIEKEENTFDYLDQYQNIVMGLDWSLGGGGKLKMKRGQPVIEAGTPSFTVPVIIGFKPGKTYPDLIYTERFSGKMSPQEEVERLIYLYKLFRCRLFVHDYGGGGYVREALVTQSGFPADQIFPVTYVSSVTAPIVNPQEPNPNRFRWSYNVDKTRSLALLCTIMNNNLIKFPKWNKYSESIYSDFLALIETYTTAQSGTERYLITQDPNKPSDFAHALNFACLGFWYEQGSYPDLASQFGIHSGALTSYDLSDISSW